MSNHVHADLQWDVFLSHASEDKQAVALSLTQELTRAGVRVWLDRAELRLGDSLRGKIDEGIARSRFGVVILSPLYLEKRWTLAELYALMAREEGGPRVVVPVLHGISRADLLKRLPLLGDRLASDTVMGVGGIVADIIRFVFAPDSGSPSQHSPHVGRRFLELLERRPHTDEIRSFLTAHTSIVSAAAGAANSVLEWRPLFGEIAPDVAVGKCTPTNGRCYWHFILLGPVTVPLFTSPSEPVPELIALIHKVAAFRRWVSTNMKAAQMTLSGLTIDFSVSVVAGRRGELSHEQRDWLTAYNDYLFGTQIRTYDWLADTAQIQTPPS